MAITLTINGEDVTGRLKKESLTISESLGQRSTLQFSLHDPTNAYQPGEGQEVIFTEDAGRRYAGTVEEVARSVGWTVERTLNISCVDYNQLADRQYATVAFNDQPLHDVVEYLVTTWLVPEGVTIGSIDASMPVVTRAVFNYQKVSDALNQISEQTGLIWFIDYDKVFWFINRGDVRAPFDLSNASKPYKNMKITTGRGGYRNRQYLIGGTGETDVRVENFTGDGVRQTFNLKFPVAKAPVFVKVNGVNQTFGIRSIDEGKDWYWSAGSTELTQDDSGTPLTDSDTLACEFVGMVSVVAVGEDASQIAARAAVEGGTGIYEDLEKDESVDVIDMAIDKIVGLLNRFAHLLPKCTYDTYKLGLRCGQLQDITVAVEGSAGFYLITTLATKWVSSTADDETDGIFQTTVTAVNGQYFGGWVEFLRKLLGIHKGIALNESDVAAVIKGVSEALTVTETFSTVLPIDDGTGDPYTPVRVCDPVNQAPELLFGVDVGVIG